MILVNPFQLRKFYSSVCDRDFNKLRYISDTQLRLFAVISGHVDFGIRGSLAGVI